MILRFALFGAECSGKSMLAQQLAEYFKEPWAPEFVRAFWDQKNGDIRASDLSAIAQGQIANEAAAVNRARRLVLCDTELITNTLWADLLFPGHCPAWLRAAAERRSHHYALYLLCDADIEFIDDGQRCFPEPAERERACALWRAALVDRHLPFVEIRGAFQARKAQAITAIEHVLKARDITR